VVCSPLESPIIHETVGADFLTVTPGVRFADESAQDQARVTTPEKAGQLGSNFIVVGRSITKAADPVAAYKKARTEFLSGAGLLTV
jgi:orotidine-5'-phosphate decarboxylase